MSGLDGIEKLASTVVRNVDEETDEQGVGLRFDLDHENLARAVLAMLPLCRDALRLYERAEKCVDRPWMGCAMDHSEIESALGDGVESLRSSMARLAGDV